MSTVYKLEYADKISTSIFLVIRLFSMIGCIFQRSPGIKNRSLWCVTSTRLGLFGAMCLGGPTGPTRPNRRIFPWVGVSRRKLVPRWFVAASVVDWKLWDYHFSGVWGQFLFFFWKLDGRKMENHLPGPSKKCQLNPRGWWIEILWEPFGTPLKVLVFETRFSKNSTALGFGFILHPAGFFFVIMKFGSNS